MFLDSKEEVKRDCNKLLLERKYTNINTGNLQSLEMWRYWSKYMPCLYYCKTCFGVEWLTFSNNSNEKHFSVTVEKYNNTVSKYVKYGSSLKRHGVTAEGEQLIKKVLEKVKSDAYADFLKKYEEIQEV